MSVEAKRLVDARAAYPNLEDGHPYDEVLFEVQVAAERSASIGKADIGALLLWKRLNLSTPWTRDLNNMPDRDVRKITSTAVELARDPAVIAPDAAEAARIALLELPGCRHGQAIASTILTAGAPNRMAVYDERAVHGLDELGHPDPQGKYSSYMTIVCSLLDVVHREHDTSWLARDIDKALYIIGAPERNRDS
jgi:hypothetical protein